MWFLKPHQIFLFFLLKKYNATQYSWPITSPYNPSPNFLISKPYLPHPLLQNPNFLDGEVEVEPNEGDRGGEQNDTTSVHLSLSPLYSSLIHGAETLTPLSSHKCHHLNPPLSLLSTHPSRSDERKP